jgi:hypothetical protein
MSGKHPTDEEKAMLERAMLKTREMPALKPKSAPPAGPPDELPSKDWQRTTQPQWGTHAMPFEHALADAKRQSKPAKAETAKPIEKAVLKAMKKGKKK